LLKKTTRCIGIIMEKFGNTVANWTEWQYITSIQINNSEID
jgi:hypothetical protein